MPLISMSLNKRNKPKSKEKQKRKKRLKKLIKSKDFIFGNETEIVRSIREYLRDNRQFKQILVLKGDGNIFTKEVATGAYHFEPISINNGWQQLQERASSIYGFERRKEFHVVSKNKKEIIRMQEFKKNFSPRTEIIEDEKEKELQEFRDNLSKIFNQVKDKNI